MTEDPQVVLQRLYVEQQKLESDIGMLRQHIELIQVSLNSYRSGFEVLKELESKSENEEMLMNVGGGIFVEARLSDPDKVLRTIGSGVRIELSREEASTQIGETITSLEERFEKSQTDYEGMVNRATIVNQQLQQLTTMMQSQPQQTPEE
ncbi:MAG: prefoldin subunit alpha [Candidatus Thorarchaeota archaeon]